MVFNLCAKKMIFKYGRLWKMKSKLTRRQIVEGAEHVVLSRLDMLCCRHRSRRRCVIRNNHEETTPAISYQAARFHTHTTYTFVHTPILSRLRPDLNFFERHTLNETRLI